MLEDKWVQLTENIKAEKLLEFLRYYWNISHKVIRANALFKAIRKEIITDKQVFSLVNEMMKYSDVYMGLMDENDDLWSDNEVRENIKLLNLFHLRQPFSLLMVAKIKLQDKDFKLLLKSIITLCFRYNVICDKNPNDQETPFNELAMMINRDSKFDLSLLMPLVIDDKEFESAFAEKSFPNNSRNMQLVRYILGKIEHFKGFTNEINISDDNASIEHILPQSPDEGWCFDDSKVSKFVYRLGNTCLLERSYNRDLQNTNFATKKNVYAKSIYYYAKYIANNYDVWNENIIMQLQKEMAGAAVTIWKLNIVRSI